jgi:hypothetical protein
LEKGKIVNGTGRNGKENENDHNIKGKKADICSGKSL